MKWRRPYRPSRATRASRGCGCLATGACPRASGWENELSVEAHTAAGPRAAIRYLTGTAEDELGSAAYAELFRAVHHAVCQGLCEPISTGNMAAQFCSWNGASFGTSVGPPRMRSMRRASTATAEDDPRELTDACERSQLHVDGELDKYFEKTRCKSTLYV